MKKSLSALIVVACILFASCQSKKVKETTQKNETTQTSQEEVDYFANNGFGNATTGNAGEHYKGITYVAYQGELEDPYVAAYDHAAKKWIGPYKAGTSLLGKKPGKKIDNHGKPTLIVDGEGYIHVVFGGHGGTPDLGKNTLGNYHDGKQLHVVSKKPMDISAWEVVDNITPFGTYSRFLKMDNGDIYLIYRHGAHRSNWVYQISRDNCRTFEPLVSFLKTKQTEGTKEFPVIWDSWYPNFRHGDNNDIIVAYNYHRCKGPVHDGERHNCYYMKFDTDKQVWFNVKGEKLQLPITKEYADKMTLVKNTGERWTHNGMSCIDDKGTPHVTSYEGDHEGQKHGGSKEIMYYKWTGTEWIKKNVGLPKKARGILKVDAPEEVSFLVGQEDNNLNEVAWWNSTDGGENFKKGTVYIANKGGKILLSDLITNAHPDARIIASQKIKGSDYAEMLLIGDNGPIKRLKTEANCLKK